MKRGKWIAVAVVVLGSVIPTGASAENISNSPLVKRDLAVAVQFWRGHPDPCNSYAVEAGRLVGNYIGETDIGGCTQRWSSQLWAVFAREYASPPSARRTEYLRWSCVLMVHEFGHTVGLQDVTYAADRYGVMYVLSSPARHLARCDRAFP